MSIPKTVLFFNPFEDFTCLWDKEPFTVKSNKKVYMQEWLATHIQKHLVDRELNKRKLPTDFECSDPTDSRYESSRSRLKARCILAEAGEAEHGSKVSQDLDLLNKPTVSSEPTISAEPNQFASSEVAPKAWCDSCDSKGMRHKKVCPKNLVKAAPKEEFIAMNALPPIAPINP